MPVCFAKNEIAAVTLQNISWWCCSNSSGVAVHPKEKSAGFRVENPSQPMSPELCQLQNSLGTSRIPWAPPGMDPNLPGQLQCLLEKVVMDPRLDTNPWSCFWLFDASKCPTPAAPVGFINIGVTLESSGSLPHSTPSRLQNLIF